MRFKGHVFVEAHLRSTFRKDMNMRTALIMTGSFLLLLINVGTAYAAKCTTVASVISSAVVADNNSYKGHVGAHIKDVGAADYATSAVGKTVYTSLADFQTIWTKLVEVDTSECPDSPGGDNAKIALILAADAGDAAVKGYVCDTVDGAMASKCTAVKDEFTPTKYYFQFLYKNTAPKLAGSNWILNTAFPRND